MPMSFQDMKGLESASKIHLFRPPKENEKEEEYKEAISLFCLKMREVRVELHVDKFGFSKEDSCYVCELPLSQCECD